jgi:hypothetical protein
VAVQLDPASIKVVVGADSNLILQVISNLLSNAVKFFPSGGEVSSRSRISARWGAFRYAIRDRACPTITKPASSKNSSKLTPPAPGELSQALLPRGQAFPRTQEGQDQQHRRYQGVGAQADARLLSHSEGGKPFDVTLLCLRDDGDPASHVR